MTIRANSAVILRDGQYAEALDEERGGTMRFVRVPDHLTAEEAQQALTEHVAWVPVGSSAWTHVEKGAHVLVEYRDGTKISGVAGVRDGKWLDIGTVHCVNLHADVEALFRLDVPTDPDAELVQRVADAVGERIEEGKVVAQTHAAYYRDVARAALAVVREHEATR